MSRAQVSKHYARILTQWPVDRLRPEVAFQNLLRKRIDAAPAPKLDQSNKAQAVAPVPTPDVASEMKEINALYSMLENRCSKKYKLSNALMRPASAPDHYVNLEKEIDELPDRSWWDNFTRKWKGMVRMS